MTISTPLWQRLCSLSFLLLFSCFGPVWGQTYCVPTSNCGSGDGFNSFVLNGVTLSQNSGCSPSGYRTFTAVAANVTPGLVCSFSGTIISSSYRQGIVIWVDANRDGTFDTSELIFQTTATQQSTFSGSFTIPTGIATGSMRMRCRAVYSTASPNIPCGAAESGDGETEDYILTVGPPTTYSPNTSNIASVSAQLNWNNLGTASSYEVQWRQQNTGNWNLITGITSTTYALANLTPGNTYEWQMRPANTATWIGGPVVFTAQFPCNAPTSLGASPVSTASAQLYWYYATAPITNAPFEVQIRVSGAASWSTISSIPNPTANSYTYYTVQNLTPGTTYQWQVRSACSPYSTSATFTTVACTVPNNLSVRSLPTSAQLSWSGPSNTPVNLQWQQQGSPTWETVASLTNTSYSLTGLTNNTAYLFRVQAVCTAQQSSSFSAPLSFTTGCQPPTSPYANAYDSRATSQAVGWNSNYASNSGVAYLAQYRPKSPANSSWTSLTTTNAMLSFTGLTPGTAYEYQVQTTCPGPVSSAFTSPPVGFTTTACLNTASNFTSSNLTATSAQVRWYSNVLTDQFVVQYKPATASSWSVVGPFTGNYNYTVSLTALSASTVYQWQVANYCTPTSSSSFAAIQSFTTTPCTNPAANLYEVANFASADLSWSANMPASVFSLQWRPSGGQWTTVGSVNLGYNTPTYSSYSYSLTGLSTNTSYEWQVALVCSQSVSSPYTPPRPFTTVCEIRATNLARTNTFSTANLSWSGYSYGETYDLYYRPQGGQWTTISSLTSTYTYFSYSLTALAGNTVYEWGVARKCSPTASSSITMGSSFTTVCQNTYQANDLITSNITLNSVQLSFNTYSPGSTFDVRYRVQNTATWTTLTGLTSGYLSLTGLTPNTTYEWQAAIRCSPTSSSTFTASQTFLTECRIPTNLYSYNVGFSSADLGFSGSTGTTIEVDYRLTGGNWTTVNARNSYGHSLTGLSTGVYEWRVRSSCGSSVFSGYSPIQSFTTTCRTPSYISVNNVSSYGARASWPSIGTGARYTLQWRQGTSGAWTDITNITRPEYVLTGLSAGGTYQVQVQGSCGAQTSPGFTTPQSFVANCPQPTGLSQTTYLSDPADSRRLNWSATNTVSYVVQWRPQNTATWNTSPVLNEQSYNSLYQITGMAPGVYEWQVGAVCADGVTTAYTSGQSFTISRACSNITAPGNNFAFPGFTVALLAWDNVGGSTGHEVRWRQQGGQDWNVATNLPFALALRGLQGNTVYEWQVRTLCPAISTPFGPLQSFTTTCRNAEAYESCVDIANALVYPYVPYNYNISNYLNAAGLSSDELVPAVEVNWHVLNTATWNTSNAVSVGRSYTISGLSNNTAYEYRVRSVCSPTVNSTFSAPGTFTTACAVPTYVNTYNTNCTGVSLSWSGCTMFGTTYTVRYRVLNTANWSTVSANNTFLPLNNLSSNTNFEVQVQANCAGGIATSFSNSYTFATTCGATECTPTSDPRSTDITSAASSLSWYYTSTSPFELQWRQGANGSWNTVQPVAGTGYRLTGLSNGTAYDWRVRSTCSDPNDYTPVSFFRTVCNIPFGPNTSLIRATQAQLNWDSFGTGTTYDVQYRTGGGGWTTVSTSNASYVLTGLTNNTTYEWQIRTNCGDGNTSAWSHSVFFSTICPAPSNLASQFIGPNSVACRWQSSASGLTYILQYRQQGSGTWNTVGGITSTGLSFSYAIGGLSEQTTYEWQVLTDCGSGNSSGTPNQPITFRTTGTAPLCNGMVTIQNGDWTNPAIWSCNRVPLATDPVTIRHNVMIPDNGTGRAQWISYDAGGQVRFGTAARLLLNQ